jgi:alpha-tubulin suppressor-like RCC1 family protein
MTVRISKSRVDLGDSRLDNPVLRSYGEIKASPSISSGTLTLDLSTASVFEVPLNANITTFTVSNPVPTGNAQSFTLIFVSDGTARTATWGNAVSWPGATAPTLSSTSGQRDFFTFYTSTSGGWFGFVAGQNYSSNTAPVNVAVPIISDTAPYNGETLTATSGTWTGSGVITYTYQWQQGTTNIGGATSINYTVQSGDVGHTLRVVVTASNGTVPNGTANSASTSAVVAGWFLWAWGQNSLGQGALGINTNTSRSSPVQVGALNDWGILAPSTVGNHVIATKKTGALWAWGKSLQGQVGNNTTIYYSSPVQIGALTNWLLPCAGYNHSGAIKTNGQLWMLGGDGTVGQLGQNSQTGYSSPVQVGARTDWAQMSANQQITAAITTGGELWVWGNNANGATGINVGTGSQSSPTQVGALTTWKYLVCWSNGIRAVKTDGTLWAWGQNNLGQVGDNTTTYRSSPVQIGALTNWTPAAGMNGMAASSNRTFHVKSDGTMWGWGKDYIGGLGLNTNYVNRSSPTQIGALTNWLTAAAGYNGGASLKTDGSYWIWGYYTAGGAENGTGGGLDAYSSPVQLGARTDWTHAKRGSNWSMGLTSTV